MELIVAKHDIDAHLLAGRLLESGVDVSTIKDRSIPSWLHGGSNPWAPVTIFVRRFQLDQARLVLAEIAYEGPSAVRDGVRTSTPRAAAAWWAAAILLGVLFSAINYVQAQRSFTRCELPLVCAEPGR